MFPNCGCPRTGSPRTRGPIERSLLDGVKGQVLVRGVEFRISGPGRKQHSGCPILATFLFLSQGWDSTKAECRTGGRVPGAGCPILSAALSRKGWETTNLIRGRFIPATPRQSPPRPSAPHRFPLGLSRPLRQSPVSRRPSRRPAWPPRPPACRPEFASSAPA